jgi:hypothetical protein
MTHISNVDNALTEELSFEALIETLEKIQALPSSDLRLGLVMSRATLDSLSCSPRDEFGRPNPDFLHGYPVRIDDAMPLGQWKAEPLDSE